MTMKKIVFLLALVAAFSFSAQAQQDKSKRASPPDSVQVTTESGATIRIHYSRPSLKGRELQSLVPLGAVWRTGANEATTFEVDKDVKVNGKELKAGKYSLYTLPGETESTIIFNKTWEQWGTQYKQEDDVLRVQTATRLGNPGVEQFTISAEPSGLVTLAWGDAVLDFTVK